MTEATNREHDPALRASSRDNPAIVVPVSDDNIGDTLTTVHRAQHRDHHVFVYCENPDSEIAALARQLDVTVVERDPAQTIEEHSLALAREQGFPGIIYVDSPAARIDFEYSHQKLRESSKYLVSAGIEYDNDSNLIIGIPAYNEEVGIGSVVLAAKSVAREVIVVDDGSSDNTVEIATDAGATVIEHDENRGKGAAVKTLFDEVCYREFDALIMIDGDGQHDPNEIPRVAQQVLDGDADLVIGSRYLKDDEDETPTYRRLGQRVLDLLTLGPSQTRLTDSQSGFRALSPRAVEELAVTTDNFGVETEMIDLASRNDLNIEERPIDARYEGIDGQTQNPLRHGLTVVAFVLQLIRDKHPLAFFGMPGAICVFLGGLYGLDGFLLYQSTGVFLPVKALGSGFIILLGMLCIFTGLILNSVSTMLNQSG